MRNLKKSLALILALVMALGVVASATVFTDVKDTDANAEAITTLNDLGILTGYTNGTFEPEGIITRAESCAVIYRALTGKTASIAAGATAFSDVASNHWASGYINYCTEMGIVNGYPDGTFKPNQQVNFAEFVTMLVRALGLDTGSLSYPNGYIAVADSQKITDDLTVSSVTQLLNRGQAAQAAYNAVFNAKYATIATMLNPFPTIAEDVLNIDTYEGVCTAVGDDDVTVGAHTFDFVKDSSILGLKVKVLYKGNVASPDKVYAIVPVTNSANEYKASEITVTGTTIAINGSTKTLTLESTPTPTYITNGATGAATDLTSVDNTNALTSFRFVDNDDDDKIEYVFTTNYVVETVNRVTEKNVYTTGGTYNLKDSDDKATKVSIPSGLAKDDLVIVYKVSANEATFTVIPKASGVVTSKDSNGKYTINGTAYALKAGCTDIEEADLGKTVEFYADPIFGYIVKADAPSSTDSVFYVDAISTGHAVDDMGKPVYKLSVIYPDGKTATVEASATAHAAVDAVTGDSGLFAYTVKNGKIDTVTAKAVTDAGAPSRDGSFIVGGTTKYVVDADSVIYLINKDGDVTAYVGTAPSFTAGTGASFKADVTDGAFPVIDYAVINVGTTGTTSVSESNDVLGYVNSISYAASGDKYVANLSIAAKGAVSNYTTVAVDSNVSTEYAPSLAGSFITFDITSDGINDVKGKVMSEGYVMGISGGVYAIAGNDAVIDGYYALADDVKVYVIDEDDVASVGVVESIITSVNYSVGNDLAYKVFYVLNGDTKIDSIFVNAEAEDSFTFV